MSKWELSLIGFPWSIDSSSASSLSRLRIPAPTFIRIAERSATGIRGQGPSSNALRAARAALGDLGDHLVGRRIAALECLSARRVDVLAVDEHLLIDDALLRTSAQLL